MSHDAAAEGRRRALVTGASSGIGAATARRLAADGYRVALMARRTEALDDVHSSLAGDGHIVVTCDVRDESSLRAGFAQVHSAFGALDLFVANAGVGYRARVAELEADALRTVIDTNIVGLLLSCREAYALLRSGNAPVCVLIASVVGRRGIPGQAAYSSSKAAVVSIGEALRLEWAEDQIAVCTLNPALTATGFFDAQPNPAGLPNPDLTDSAEPADVAEEIVKLDCNPRPERSLRWKWRLLGTVGAVFPRWADRLVAKRLGGGWRAPSR